MANSPAPTPGRKRFSNFRTVTAIGAGRMLIGYEPGYTGEDGKSFQIDTTYFKGEKGDPGTNGTNGVNGATPTFASGTVQNGAPGSNAAASIVPDGTTPNLWRINMTIPRGNQGAQGLPGNDGAPGTKGDKGDKGDTGPRPILTKGTITAVAPGDNPTWTFVETATPGTYIISLALPRGEDGAAGEQGAPGAPGSKVLFGEGTPASNVGANGDVYFDTTNKAFHSKASNIWSAGTSVAGANGTNGTNGTNGADGRTIRYGTGVPNNALGVDGDSYIDTTNLMFYGPKASGNWPAGISMKGTAGTNGTNGANGANGNTILSGSASPPSPAIGVNGDFYYNPATFTIYGPKANDAWPAGVVLKGADGAAGQGVPAGGTTGQVLRKTSSTNYATEWAAAASGLPTGGTAGQVLTKNSTAEGDAVWANPVGAGARIDGSARLNDDFLSFPPQYNPIAANDGVFVSIPGCNFMGLAKYAATNNPVIQGISALGPSPGIVRFLQGADGTYSFLCGAQLAFIISSNVQQSSSFKTRIRMEAGTPANTYPCLLGWKANPTVSPIIGNANAIGYWIGVSANYRLEVNHQNSNTRTQVETTFTLTAGQWVVLEIQTDATSVRFYANGTLLHTLAMSTFTSNHSLHPCQGHYSAASNPNPGSQVFTSDYLDLVVTPNSARNMYNI